MKIWSKNFTLENLNTISSNTFVSHCHIEFTQITDDTLEAEMPFATELTQPAGILHGGANCVLAETLGSVAANCVIDTSTHYAVGQSIHTSHIRPVNSGMVKGIARSIHLGSKSHIWEIKTYNTQGKITSDTRLTMAIIKKESV